MATVVTRYVSNDGEVWKSGDEAKRRDGLLCLIGVAQSFIKDGPTKHETFVQQSKGDIFSYKRCLIALAKEFAPHDIWNRDPNEIHARGFAARWLDDSCTPLARAWYRLMCTDKKFREWDQPYFAIEADREGA